MSKEIVVGTEFIQSTYFKKPQNQTFLFLSDIHYHPKVDKELYKMIVKDVIERRPDYVVITGDLFETDDFLDDSKSVQFFDTFIHCLAEISKVVMIPGNHDITDYNAKTFMNKQYSGESRSIKYLESLNRLTNVYFLNNEQLDMNSLTFIGLNPRNETYLKRNDPTTRELFIEDYLKGNYQLNSENYNILLTHSSLPLLDPIVLSSSTDFNLYDLNLSGHWHNGHMPKWMDYFVKNTDIGIFTVPRIAPIPGIPCRGRHPFSRGEMFISRGFRKFGLFSFIDEISEHNMDVLILSNSKVKTK